MFTEKSAERTQTLEPARTTHIRYGHLCRSQKVGGPFHPAPGEIAMRSFAKETGEAAVEVIRRKGGLSGDLMEVERLSQRTLDDVASALHASPEFFAG